MMKFKKRQGGRDNEAGFTLLEVIAAVSILTVGLLAVASMQTAAIQGNDRAYRVTEGTTWAQNRLEYLMALPYEASLLSLGDDQEDPSKDDPDSPQPPNEYTITYDIKWGPIPDKTKRITVYASRQDRGKTEVRQLTSIKNTL